MKIPVSFSTALDHGEVRLGYRPVCCTDRQCIPGCCHGLLQKLTVGGGVGPHDDSCQWQMLKKLPDLVDATLPLWGELPQVHEYGIGMLHQCRKGCLLELHSNPTPVLNSAWDLSVSGGSDRDDVLGLQTLLALGNVKGDLLTLWGSRSRPVPLTCVIGTIGRHGMIVSRVHASALLGLLSAGESAVVARPLVSV